MSGGAGVRACGPTAGALLGAAVRLCVAASLLTGCAYYNGMYNTRRFARNAERSERAGRTSEAADRWRQVVLHADTLLARHPGSRWADDAELLKGRALVALGSWPLAVRTLESAKVRAGSEEQRRDAQYWLAMACAGRRDYACALANFDSALASARRDHRQAVRLARGRTLLAMGRPAEALRDFEAVTGGPVHFDRALAALALRQPAPAAAFADSAVGARGVTPERWLAFADTLGQLGGTAEATALVDRLLAAGGLPITARARLLLADGDRLLAAGLDSLALARWATAARVAPRADEGRVATVRALRAALRRPDAASLLPSVRERLEDAVAAGGEAAREARDVLRVLAAADSLPADGYAGDARAFQAAEWLRDSLPSRPLAAQAFAAMAARWPDSPWAPKAVLAAISAGHPAADSLGAVLADRYGDSPYARAASGEAADAEVFAAAEESLALALEAASRPAAGSGDTFVPLDADDERVRQRQAAAAGARTAGSAPPPAVRAAPVRQPAHPRNPEP